MKINRRDFIVTTGAGAIAALTGCGKIAKASMPGGIMGASAAAGHRLRDGKFPAPVETVNTSVVIVGAGMAGLAAARRLDRRGMRDLLLLDLEGAAGGNAASGRNSVSAYPWGAHYVPLPNDESTEVLALFEELGIIRGHDATGAPIYDEEALCSDPMERLFDCGVWQEGFLPQAGISDADRRDYSAFFARMEEFRSMHGADGHPAFTIPLDLSSATPRFRSFNHGGLDNPARLAFRAPPVVRRLLLPR